MTKPAQPAKATRPSLFCIFCGGTTGMHLFGPPLQRYVHHDDGACDAMGPVAETDEDAIAKWLAPTKGRSDV